MCLFLAVIDVCVPVLEKGTHCYHLITFSCIGPSIQFASSNIFVGRLKVYINGQYGTICSEGFDINEADIICRQRFYSPAASYSTASDLGYVFKLAY